MSSTKPKFQWDDSVLTPDSITVNFSKLTTKDEDAAVEFYELPRQTLVEFVAESLEKKIYETGEDGKLTKDDEGKEIKRSFKQVELEHSKFLFKYLSKSTRGKRPEKFFESLELTATMLTGLVDMLLKLNHIEEVLATSGNWLMLPMMRDLFAEAAITSENPAPTSPVLLTSSQPIKDGA